MTTATKADLDRAEKLAREVGRTFPQVDSLYLVGSRARGTARADSDFDIVAMVTDSSRRRGWRTAGRPPYKGFPASLDGIPIEWCLVRATEVGREEMVELRGALLLWQREEEGA